MLDPTTLEITMTQHLHQYALADSTLGELRRILKQCAEMPDDAVVRAKVGFGNPSGAKIKSLAITTDGSLPRVGDQP